ncbi:MAG: hypothetical protein AAF081_07935 [Actinomycetota bacterium]
MNDWIARKSKPAVTTMVSSWEASDRFEPLRPVADAEFSPGRRR